MSVSVKWLDVKTASEMTYIVSGGALNSTQTQTKPKYVMLYPQNGDRIVTIDSVTSLHLM